MAEAFLTLDYLNALIDVEEELAEDEEIENQRVTRRVIRDVLDPFDCNDRAFRQFYRVSRELARDLCDRLRPALERGRTHAVSVKKKQVLTALRFFATGSNQGLVGQDAYLSVSQPVVSSCINRVAGAINDILLREVVKFPMTREERNNARLKSARAPQPFEGALGAIDCTHIAIRAPKEHEEDYVNHHQYHSMNVQMVCDPDMRILQVGARFGGARHDAFIWSGSPVLANMKTNYENGERNTWLIGDSRYPLEPWLLTPISDAAPGTPEFWYTQYHCKARSIIERTFGVLKGVWNCLSKRRVLLYEPAVAGRIMNACVLLHNLRLQYNIEVGDDEVEEVAAEDELRAKNGAAPVGRHRVAEGRRIRDAYIRHHFL